MSHRHRPLAETLGAGGPDVVRVEHLEHRRPLVAAVGGDVDVGERDDGEDHVLDAVDDRIGRVQAGLAERVHQTYPRPEEEGGGQGLEHQGEPEDRHREAEEADGGGRVVEEAVLLLRRHHTEDDCKRDRDQFGHEHQLQGVPDRTLQIGPDRLIADRGGAELVEEHVLHPEGVLDDDRVVQMLAVDDVLQCLLAEVGDQPELGERVGDQRHPEEDQEGSSDQDRDAVEQPTGNEGCHAVPPSWLARTLYTRDHSPSRGEMSGL